MRDDHVKDCESSLDDTRAAFDSVAANYDGPRGNNDLIQDMRREMWRWLDASFPQESHLIDLGCGTGLDAVRMADRGHSILATDWSPRMVERTHGRAAAGARLSDRVRTAAIGAHELERIEGKLDCSTASTPTWVPLNCLPDLAPVSRECARLVKPGGRLVFTVIGRWCPWEIAYYASRGDWSRSRRAVRAWHDTCQDERAHGVDALLDSHGALSAVCSAISPSYIAGPSAFSPHRRT